LPAPDPARRLREAQLALMLLTRLPAGQLSDPVPPLGQAAWAFPLVGLLTGVALWATHAAALALGLGALPSALLALAVTAWLTGGLHWDGLADCADGLGAGRDRSRALEIMRDSRIGSYGVLALLFALALSASALAQLDGAIPLPLALCLGVASRLAMVALLWALPPARSDGLGQQVAGIPATSLLPGLAALALLLPFTGLPGAALLAASAVMALVIGHQARKRLGGQTGDVLGATQVSAETLALLTLAALG
jgi:adenosylcobinamide-GDP ribazoletransferase